MFLRKMWLSEPPVTWNMPYLEIELSRQLKWDTLTGMGAKMDAGLDAGQV